MEEKRVTQDLPVTHTRTHLGPGAQQHGNRLETTRLNHESAYAYKLLDFASSVTDWRWSLLG